MSLDVDSIRARVRMEYRARIDTGTLGATYQFVDEMTAAILRDEPDVDQMVRRIIHSVVDYESRVPRQGVRTAEIVLNEEGIREDLNHQQMVIPQLEERGRAKIDQSENLAAAGRADVAVAAECSRRARSRGMDPLSTLVGMVMSRDEEIAFRDEIRKAG